MENECLQVASMTQLSHFSFLLINVIPLVKKQCGIDLLDWCFFCIVNPLHLIGVAMETRINFLKSQDLRFLFIFASSILISFQTMQIKNNFSPFRNTQRFKFSQELYKNRTIKKFVECKGLIILQSKCWNSHNLVPSSESVILNDFLLS